MRAPAATARAALVGRPGAPHATPVRRATRSAAATRPRGDARSIFRAGAAGGAGAAAEAARLLGVPAPLARPPSSLAAPAARPPGLTDVMYQVVWPAATEPRAPSLGSAERAQLLLRALAMMYNRGTELNLLEPN